jgi:hypothetical protein
MYSICTLTRIQASSNLLIILGCFLRPLLRDTFVNVWPHPWRERRPKLQGLSVGLATPRMYVCRLIATCRRIILHIHMTEKWYRLLGLLKQGFETLADTRLSMCMQGQLAVTLQTSTLQKQL